MLPPYAPGMPPPYAPAFMHALACPKPGEVARPAAREGAGCMLRCACGILHRRVAVLCGVQALEAYATAYAA